MSAESSIVVGGVPRHHEMIGVYGLLIRDTPQPAVLLELRAGHLDAGESVVTALVRELGEELAIGADPAAQALSAIRHGRAFSLWGWDA
ncbi:NUDIX domain-containing protein [Streptomyces sp. NBC_01262]|uniref:NUDIX domain-containing protein n=1 Tax=Streptomyces sp. NBC_01262 TaxID=2903803 RepID=UPI002E3823E4|nr:NUDIX domain-containing protein [Streptomyces sp. NBC_01262]